jgi:hypothetical protein
MELATAQQIAYLTCDVSNVSRASPSPRTITTGDSFCRSPEVFIDTILHIDMFLFI